MDMSERMDVNSAADEHMARHSLLFRVIAEEEERKRRERRRRRLFHGQATAAAHEKLIGGHGDGGHGDGGHGGHQFLPPEPAPRDPEMILAQMRAELEASLEWNGPPQGPAPEAEARRARRRPLLPFLRRNRA